MPHDFKKFPELTNAQMALYYWDSPHKQILGDFTARVVKVTDGDTIRVRTNFRDFDFPVRLTIIDAPEKKEPGWQESKSWLESQIMGEDVEIKVPTTRIEKWGRILGEIIHMGMNINEQSMAEGHSVYFWKNDLGRIPDFHRQLKEVEDGFKF